MDKVLKFWKTTAGKITIIVSLLVILFCFCCMVIVIATPTPKAAVVATVPSITQTLEATPMPTSTQAATATLPGTNTPAPTIAPEILTQQAQATMTAEIAAYVKMDPRELLTYPKNHIGEQIVITGKIFNINGDTELQMYVGGGFDAVYVLMKKPFTGIYEDDTIKVYGIIAGENCGTNTFGGEVCQPLLIDAFFEKQ